MSAPRNPFEYEAANRLNDVEVLRYYTEDHNYSRFVHSKRNIYIIGERGTGKTMMLKYHSLPLMILKKELSSPIEILPIYVGCNTPIYHRREFELLDALVGSMLSEHILITSFLDGLVKDLTRVAVLVPSEEQQCDLIAQLEFVFDEQVPPLQKGFLHALRMMIDKQHVSVMKAIASRSLGDSLRHVGFFSFSATMIPLIRMLHEIPMLAGAHLSFLVDDIQHLNVYQTRTLNSWIAFRDNTDFSFKVTSVKVDRPSLETSSGGMILEGHDYVLIDLELPYQNKESDFGLLARGIIERRIGDSLTDCEASADAFFPTSPSLVEGIRRAEQETAWEGVDHFDGRATPKQLRDYIYKRARANYFRARDPKANLPPYSGIETIIHLSTGIVRNLLQPCYYMYDKTMSRNPGAQVREIPHAIQTEVLLERSRRLWQFLEAELPGSIEDCSELDGKSLFSLFDQLMILFRDRLLHHESEPRAVKFVISDYEPLERHERLEHILKIARRAQLLYTYQGSAKSRGRRETYYVPNRILLPIRGLDPNGQHAAVSIKADNLLRSATDGTPLSLQGEEMNSNDLFELEN